MVFIFIILILTISILFFIIKKESGEEKWKKQLNQTLLSLGFDKNESNNDNLAKRLTIINERKIDRRKICNLHCRREKNFDIYICDYLISSSNAASGDLSWERHLIICIISQQLNLPRFSIEAIPQLEGWMGKLVETAFSLSPLPLQEKNISNPQFNKRFKLYCSEEIEPSKFLEKTLLNEFLQQGNVNLDAKFDTLAFHNLDIEIDRLRNKFDGQKIITLVSFAKNIMEKLCQS